LKRTDLAIKYRINLETMALTACQAYCGHVSTNLTLHQLALLYKIKARCGQLAAVLADAKAGGAASFVPGGAGPPKKVGTERPQASWYEPFMPCFGESDDEAANRLSISVYLKLCQCFARSPPCPFSSHTPMSLRPTADAFGAVRERAQLREEVANARIAKAEFTVQIDDLNRTVGEQAKELERLKMEMATMTEAMNAKPKIAASFGKGAASFGKKLLGST
jgi:uncharacterized coiled-coil protein SlyX